MNNLLKQASIFVATVAIMTGAGAYHLQYKYAHAQKQRILAERQIQAVRLEKELTKGDLVFFQHREKSLKPGDEGYMGGIYLGNGYFHSKEGDLTNEELSKKGYYLVSYEKPQN